MTQRHAVAMMTLAWTMCACHSLPPEQPMPAVPAGSAAPGETSGSSPIAGDAAPPSAGATPNTEPVQIPPCAPVVSSAKPAPKRKPKAVVLETPPAAPPPSMPPPSTPPKPVADAGVKRVTVPESSILGKKVQGAQGDDLGRVVDVLADAQGRVRIAIIEFGGFLGVGNRRIAVDWSLHRFHPGDPEAPVLLDVAREEIQGAPQYQGAERPLALMAPEVLASPRANTSH